MTEITSYPCEIHCSVYCALTQLVPPTLTIQPCLRSRVSKSGIQMMIHAFYEEAELLCRFLPLGKRIDRR